MKLLVMSALWPHPGHSIRAANVVFYEMLSALAKQPDVTVGLLKCHYAGTEIMRDDERAGIGLLRDQGVAILKPFEFAITGPHRRAYQRMLWPKLEDHYPGIAYIKPLEARVREFSTDIMFIPWSEWLTGACADINVAKFAYYGNPDPKAFRAQLAFQRSVGEIGRAETLAHDVLIRQLERAHLRQAFKYDWFGDVAHNDAAYYQQKGHKNAFYIQNMWIDRGLFAQGQRKVKTGPDQVVRIIANVGKLAGTANTYGLRYLGKEVLPALARIFGNNAYQVHILGAGKPHPVVAQSLDRPEVIMRGFVDDIDQELLAADVFLCVNNATDFKVGHTRYLHAWSLGCCVVAHRDASLSMPEIRHNENALLGDSGEEIAFWVAEAARDEQLRRRIGQGGYATFKECFTAERVVRRIHECISPGIQQEVG